MEPKTKKIILIVFVILVICVLVLSLQKCVFGCSDTTRSVTSINSQLLKEIDDSLEQDENLVIFVNSDIEKTAVVESGQERFGIPIGFAPEDSQVWGTQKSGCVYNIEIVDKQEYCMNNGWNGIEEDIFPGTSNQLFNEVQNGKGYALVRINIPKEVEPCIQTFVVTVLCAEYPDETVSNYFNIQVIKKKGFF